jgi:hypothetical protein
VAWEGSDGPEHEIDDLVHALARIGKECLLQRHGKTIAVASPSCAIPHKWDSVCGCDSRAEHSEQERSKFHINWEYDPTPPARCEVERLFYMEAFFMKKTKSTQKKEQ